MLRCLSQQPWHYEGKVRPELRPSDFDRRTRNTEFVSGFEFAHRLRHLRCWILDRLCFVEGYTVPFYII